MTTPHTSCAGEPLSLWCDHCRLVRLVAMAQDEIAQTGAGLARVLNPETRHDRIYELEQAGARLWDAITDLGYAAGYAHDLAKEKKPA